MKEKSEFLESPLTFIIRKKKENRWWDDKMDNKDKFIVFLIMSLLLCIFLTLMFFVQQSQLNIEYQTTVSRYNRLQEDFTSLESSYSVLEAEYQNLTEQNNLLIETYDELRQEHDELTQVYDELNYDYQFLSTQYKILKESSIGKYVHVDFIALLSTGVQYWKITNIVISNNGESYLLKGFTLSPIDNGTFLFSLSLPIMYGQSFTNVIVSYDCEGIQVTGNGIVFTIHYEGRVTETIELMDDRVYYLGG